MPEETTIRPSPVVTSEAPTPKISGGEIAAPYQMLGSALDKAGEGLEQLATPLAEQAGYNSVSTDAQGNMTVTRLPIFGAAGVAYSRALKFSALAQADADSKRKDIEISRQYANDPEGYLVAANKYRDDVVEHVGGMAGPEVGLHLKNAIDTTTTYNYRRLWSEQQATIARNFNKDTEWTISSNRENLISLIKNGGLDTPDGRKKAQEFATNIDAALNERANNPILAAPKSESDRTHTELGRDMEAAKFEHGITKTLANPQAPYQGDINTSSTKYGLDPTLVARQIYQESRFNENALSPRGAQGIAQFMPATASQYGVDVRNPQSSIAGMAHMMSDLSTQFGGNYGLALAGYNWGAGNVAQWLASGANPDAMPRETRNYIQNITGQPIQEWIRGARPSSFAIQNLPAPYSAQGGAQRAADMIEAMRNNQSVDPVQRQLNIERGIAAIKDWHQEIVRNANIAEVGQKARDEAFENQVIQDSATGKPIINENQIKTWPNVSYEAKNRMLKFLKQEDMPEPFANVSRNNAIEAFKRMELPAGDAQRINSVGQIRDMYGNGQLTRADEDWLEKKFSDSRAPGGERLADIRKEFNAAVKGKLDKSTMMNIDDEGGLRYYAFQRMVDSKVDSLKAQGKDPSVLFDPNSPEYLGDEKTLQQYTRPLAEQAAAKARALSSGVAPPQGGSTIPAPPAMVRPVEAAPAILPRQSGESIDDYDKRAGIR